MSLCTDECLLQSAVMGQQIDTWEGFKKVITSQLSVCKTLWYSDGAIITALHHIPPG